MSEDELVFVVAPLGGLDVLLPATRVESIASPEETASLGSPVHDLAAALALPAPTRPCAVEITGKPRSAWFAVAEGLRVMPIAAGLLRPMPRWLRRRPSLLRALAPLPDRGFGFEIDVDELLRRCAAPRRGGGEE